MDLLYLRIYFQEKLYILQSYLQQVEEQNEFLASTMTELEKEAQKRVKQMEKRLKSSAKTTMVGLLLLILYILKF